MAGRINDSHSEIDIGFYTFKVYLLTEVIETQGKEKGPLTDPQIALRKLLCVKQTPFGFPLVPIST
jgi:hypothetical protein